MRINPITGLLDPNGTTDIDLGAFYRGEWTPYTSYIKSDFVSRDSRLHECQISNTGVEPIVTDTDWWTQPFSGQTTPPSTPSNPVPQTIILIPQWYQVDENGAIDISMIAGVQLGGQRIVAVGTDGKAIYADAQLAHSKKVLGVTMGSVNADETVLIKMSGRMNDSGWTFTPGATLYLGINSLLSQTPPTTGFVKVMGIAISATSVALQMQPSIVLQ